MTARVALRPVAATLGSAKEEVGQRVTQVLIANHAAIAVMIKISKINATT